MRRGPEELKTVGGGSDALDALAAPNLGESTASGFQAAVSTEPFGFTLGGRGITLRTGNGVVARDIRGIPGGLPPGYIGYNLVNSSGVIRLKGPSPQAGVATFGRTWDPVPPP